MTEIAPVSLPRVLTVGQLSTSIDKPINDVISTLMRFGVMASINQDIDFDTAAIVAEELGVLVVEDALAEEASSEIILGEKAITRPPVVTIMGHVDHGKTTLLDTIRHTNVAAGEAGGITQAISSYQVIIPDPDDPKKERLITFVDTPGHSAFEAMRKHGASITDLVVLVVAANEGVKPQTKEAIKHALAMNVPVVVALNKIDLPDANADKVKRELADAGLMTEEWGGQIPIVSISAKSGDGVDKLLEVIVLATDLMELKADDEAPLVGVVIESHMEAGLGPVATVLIQNGTLKVGDTVVMGEAWGRVRLIEDHRGKRIRQATAAMPVMVSGLSSVPAFGEKLQPVADEKSARELSRQQSAVRLAATRQRVEELTKTSKQVGDVHELAIVLKADAQGSLNAIADIVNALSNEDVRVVIVKSGVGEVGESDITSAAAAHASILCFNIKLSPAVKKMAQQNNVVIQPFKIIYELETALAAAVEELMPFIDTEEEIGRVVVLQRFNNNRKHPVVGGSVTLGEMKRGQKVKVTCDDKTIAEGIIIAVRRGRTSVDGAKSGVECGLELNITSGEAADIQPKDYVRAIIITKVKKVVTA